ncbi:MAG: flagellar basal body L-ring protein FlgH, partial [Proteobacteria bacterium]|nr:flagellar basal body L-ring protein FlgH [Pseudomonadota bacterium]
MMRASFSLAGLAAALLATTAADAKLFGKKAPAEDFTAARLAPLPQPAADAQPNGAIFQVASGYAALHEGWRARRVGDLLTIVLVERTAASKSASSKLDSGGGFGLTPPSTGPLSLFKSTDASAS